MSNIHKLSDPDEAAASACVWLARIDRGLSKDEDRELKDWLSQDHRHAAALLRTASLWDKMDTLSRLADLFPEPAPPPNRARLKLTFALAIPGLVALAIGLFMSRFHAPPVVTDLAYSQAFETAIGEHSTVRLPDGTELTLNTNSRVQAEFKADGRTLRLEKGEFFVHVARDPGRPLTVFAGDKLVRAVGTSFNVEIKDSQHVEVIVTEGKVLIGIADKKAPESQTAWLEQFDSSVVAGQRVLLSDQHKEVQDIGADEIDVKLAWRAGNLVFHGEPLADALGEIERYTPVTFVIKDEELKTIRVAGLFKAGDVEGLLETLRRNFNISYERVGAERIVLKSE